MRPSLLLPSILILGCSLLGGQTGQQANQEPPAAPQPPSGPAVGETIPYFEAADQHGAARSFDNLKGPQGLLLLFYRSADW